MEIEIVNYIKNARGHNLSDSEIKQNLFNASWEAAEVDEAFAHVKAMEHQPLTNKDEDLRPKPSTASDIGETSPVLSDKPVITHADIAITEQHFQTSAKTSILKKPWLWLTLIGTLLLAGGYVFYVYAYNNPTKVWKKFVTNEKNPVYQSKFSLSYTDNEKLENTDSSNLFKLSDVKLSFEGKSYVDATDVKNPQSSADVQYTFGSGNTSFSTGFKYRLLNKILYVNIGENPFLNSIINSLSQGKKIEWVKMDLNALEDELNKNQSSEQAKFNEIFNPSFQKELSKLWEDASLVKIEKYLGKEKINEVNTFHFKNTIDKQAVKDVFIAMFTKIVNAYKEKGGKIEDKDVENVKTVITTLVDKMEIQEFETWIGTKDFRLYRAKFTSNAPSVISLIKNSMGTATDISKDAKRIADVRQMATALELYYNDNNGYPDGTKDGQPIGLSPNYIGTFPQAPTPTAAPCNDYWNSYWYTPTGTKSTNNGKTVYSSYEMTFCLSQAAGGYQAGIAKLTPMGIQNTQCSDPENKGLCPETPQDIPKTLTDEEQIKDFISKLSFNAKLVVESNYSDYDKIQKVQAPENTTDFFEIFKQGNVLGSFIKAVE